MKSCAPLAVAFVIGTSAAAHAQLVCGAPGPDAAIRDIGSIQSFGSGAYGAAFSLVNLGTAAMPVEALTPQHPGEATNLFRLEDGVLEQVGMSWVFHEYFALEAGGVCTCSAVGGGDIGPGCQSSTTGSGSGLQGRMGPRSQVNPVTGEIGIPHSDSGGLSTTDRRLTVPAGVLGAGPQWIFEVVALSADESGPRSNNVSHRAYSWTGSSFTPANAVVQGQPAIMALAAHGYTITTVDVPGDGRLILASRATPEGEGTWVYEYALFNQGSGRAVGSFLVPLPPNSETGDTGFHDVDYFDEPYDDADWTLDRVPTGIEWSTTPFAINPDANAIRWGTLYNFRFQFNGEPATGLATIGLFAPNTPDSFRALVVAPAGACPADLDGDGLVGSSDLAALLGAWGAGGPADLDGNGFVASADLASLLGAWGPCS